VRDAGGRGLPAPGAACSLSTRITAATTDPRAGRGKAHDWCADAAAAGMTRFDQTGDERAKQAPAVGSAFISFAMF
jgi:hypothetical protein